MASDDESGGTSLAQPDDAELERRRALIASLYADLHRRAHGFMRSQRPDHTLQTTALVHEVCVRLLDREELDISGRDQVLALAATAMRSVLVDHARMLARQKRRPPGRRVPLVGDLARLARQPLLQGV